MSLLNKSHLAATVGNIIEWYDFCLYGYLAPLLAQAFFPSHNIYNSLMYVFLTFASGYIMRPLGGVIFGHLGDSIGHGNTLYYAICSIVIPTFIIGLLPSYQQVGIWAPISLVLIRLLQGLSAGGQYSGSLSFLRAKSDCRGAQVVSMAYIGSLGGYLLASSVGAFSTHFFSKHLAWRIPFLLTVFFIPCLKYCKAHLFGTMKCTKASQIPIVQLLTRHKKAMVKAFLLACIGGVYYSSFFIFLISYMEVHVGLPMSKVLFLNTLCLISSGAFIMLFAKLADRFGRKPVMLWSSIFLALILYPAFALLNTGNLFYSFLGVWLLTTSNTAFMAACAVVYVELFPKSVQYSGCAICYNIGAGVVGGLTPFFLTFLLHRFDALIMREVLIFFACIAAVFIFMVIPETAPAYKKI